MSEPELKHLNPKQAWELLQHEPRAILVDIRSTMEYLFVGHPKGSIHIPWMDEPDWTVNPDFVRRVRELMLGGAICDSDSGACVQCRNRACPMRSCATASRPVP